MTSLKGKTWVRVAQGDRETYCKAVPGRGFRRFDTVNDRVAPMFGFITQLYLICCNYHTFSFEKQAYKEKFKRPNFRSEREQCTVGNV